MKRRRWGKSRWEHCYHLFVTNKKVIKSAKCTSEAKQIELKDDIGNFSVLMGKMMSKWLMYRIW